MNHTCFNKVCNNPRIWHKLYTDRPCLQWDNQPTTQMTISLLGQSVANSRMLDGGGKIADTTNQGVSKRFSVGLSSDEYRTTHNKNRVTLHWLVNHVDSIRTGIINHKQGIRSNLYHTMGSRTSSKYRADSTERL